MIGEIRQNFTEASASVGLILATALQARVFVACTKSAIVSFSKVLLWTDDKTSER